MFTKGILNPRLFQSLSIWASSYFQDNSEQIAFVPRCFAHMGCTSQSSCLSFSIFLNCFLPDYKYLTSLFSKHLLYNSYKLFFFLFLWGVNLLQFLLECREYLSHGPGDSLDMQSHRDWAIRTLTSKGDN